MIKMFAVLLLLLNVTVLAQFKSQVENQPSVSQSLVHPTTTMNSLLGLLNSENFMMHHSFSLSYLTSGGQGLSLASYTNSMFYKISDPLSLRFDVTLQGSPFGNSYGLQQNDLNKIFLSNAELNYRPMDNMFIKIQYSQQPFYRYQDDPYSPLNYKSYRDR